MSTFQYYFALIAIASGFVDCSRINAEHMALGGFIEDCQKTLENALDVERASVVLNSPDAIQGKWVSESCEVRPGSEFLLRSYTFHKNSSFKLIQYYYKDEFCTNPAYTIIARGQLRVRNLYSLATVSIVPHAPDVALHLTAKVNSTCPGLVRKRWRASKEYVLLNLSEDHIRGHRPYMSHEETYKMHSGGYKHYFPEKFNCLHSLSLVFHELHHYEMQIRPHMDDMLGKTYYRQELLLGDIHTKLESRASYKPTAFQVPLLRVDMSVEELLSSDKISVINKDFPLIDMKKKNVPKVVFEKSYIGHFDVGTIDDLESIFSTKSEENIESDNTNEELYKYCSNCPIIANANEKSPPHLKPKSKLPLYLKGEWISTRCEQRPMNLFLTRHFKFYPSEDAWIVEYKFYYNSVCSRHSFSVTAAGHYKIGALKNRGASGTEVDFHLEKASLTVFDQNMMVNLEQDPQCGLGPWILGEPRDMSGTHGCPTLGLIVPNVEYELLKMDINNQGSLLLYMGQAETNNRRRGVKDRPTSYQQPLIQCRGLPLHSENFEGIIGSQLYGDYYGYADAGSTTRAFNIILLSNLILLALIS